jgi:hypothetical protein
MISKLPGIAVVTITREFACACAGRRQFTGRSFDIATGTVRQPSCGSKRAIPISQVSFRASRATLAAGVAAAGADRPSCREQSDSPQCKYLPAHSRCNAGTPQSSRLRGFINNTRATRINRAAWLNDDACLRWQPNLVLPRKTIDTYARNGEPRHGEFEAVLRPRGAGGGAVIDLGRSMRQISHAGAVERS